MYHDESNERNLQYSRTQSEYQTMTPAPEPLSNSIKKYEHSVLILTGGLYKAKKWHYIAE